MKYRDNMTDAETAQFLAEVDAIEAAYAAAAAADNAREDADALTRDPDDEPVDQMDELRRAALDCHGRP